MGRVHNQDRGISGSTSVSSSSCGDGSLFPSRVFFPQCQALRVSAADCCVPRASEDFHDPSAQFRKKKPELLGERIRKFEKLRRLEG